jgi:hypothetical protein
MYRVWYSTESFVDYIIDNTALNGYDIVKNKIYESDANNPARFHAMPDHIRKILYLDAPDLIVEKDNEPIFSIRTRQTPQTSETRFCGLIQISSSMQIFSIYGLITA